ncbi:MAG: hypothetical protein Q7J76_02370, partial [Candidatus Brocadiaceae bacterium]|nr:hypothetical protein [Candidatus Brocadiaceae bacterium]
QSYYYRCTLLVRIEQSTNRFSCALEIFHFINLKGLLIPHRDRLPLSRLKGDPYDTPGFLLTEGL